MMRVIALLRIWYYLTLRKYILDLKLFIIIVYYSLQFKSDEPEEVPASTLDAAWRKGMDLAVQRNLTLLQGSP